MKNSKNIGSGRRPTRSLIRKAATLVANGEPVRQAMRKIGYADSTADKNQRALVAKPEFQEQVGRIRAALVAKEGKVFEKVATVMLDGLAAEETKFFQYEGEVTDERNVIAWGERRQYAELITRLFGELNPKDDPSQRVPMNLLQIFQIVVDARRARGLEV